MVGSTRSHNYADTMAKHKSGGNSKTTGQANKIAALEAELAALKRGNSGGNGKKNTNKHKKRKTSFVKPAPVILAVADTKEQVERVTKTKIWRKCKFLAMKEELMAVSYEIMREIPQFRSMIGDSKLEDPQVTAQVEAFMGAYGETVTKTINNCRTNVQNALRTSFLLRESTGAHMPTCEELFNVIHRQGLEKDDDNAQKEQARDVFKWFWDDLLPKVCGKTRFGRSIRHYTTICEAHHPNDSHHKLVTSSDEACVLILYENCYDRFMLAAELRKQKKTLTKEEKDKCDRYKSRWSVSTDGHCQWGGWKVEGRDRFKMHKKSIAKARKKAHVRDVELSILEEIKASLDTKEDKKEKKPKAAPVVPSEYDPGFFDSDNEGSQANVLANGSGDQVYVQVPIENGEGSRRNSDEEASSDDDEEDEEE